jgi:hypothetical protein
MGSVHRIGAVDLARSDYSDRRFPLLHGPYLHRGCLGAQDHVVGDIKGVLGVPGGMVFGDVQGLKIVVVVFNLRPFNDVEAHS